jgi:hypothetical protein
MVQAGSSHVNGWRHCAGYEADPKGRARYAFCFPRFLRIRIAFHLDAMGIVRKTIEDAVCQCRDSAHHSHL